MNKENDEEIIENTLEINEDSINKKNIELNDFKKQKNFFNEKDTTKSKKILIIQMVLLISKILKM